jgi:hypothetical protein
MDKWGGHRPDDQIKNVAKLVVTAWAREHPGYHDKQLGTNFTGQKKMGGLLSALGRSSGLSLRPITAYLKDNVRQAGSLTLEDLYKKFDAYLQTAPIASTSHPQQQPHPQTTTQQSTTPTNPKPNNRTKTRTTNNSSTSKPNTPNQGSLLKHFNPLNAIPEDLTHSQEEKTNTQVEADDMHDETNSEKVFFDDGVPPATTDKDPPLSPSKVFNAFSSTPASVGSASTAALMLGGMVPLVITSTNPADPSSGTSN